MYEKSRHGSLPIFGKYLKVAEICSVSWCVNAWCLNLKIKLGKRMERLLAENHMCRGGKEGFASWNTRGIGGLLLRQSCSVAIKGIRAVMSFFLFRLWQLRRRLKADCRGL